MSIPTHLDSRGALTVVEGGIDVPFAIKRVYLVHDVIGDRGGHAHRDTYQIVTAATGRCELALSDGDCERTWTLDDPTRGVFLVPMLFIRMRDFSPGTVLLVIASTHYDKSRSIYSWDDYLKALGE